MTSTSACTNSSPPKSPITQPNGGGGDPDAPQQTTTQTSVDPELANVIEAGTAGVEGRKPNLPQQPTTPLDPETARLNEIATAAVQGRKPNLPVESSTPFVVDNSVSKGYNGAGDIGDAIEVVEAEVAQQQQNVNNVAKPVRITCIRQDLAGKCHPETGVLYTERIVTIDGQQYIVVAPEFDSLFDTQLPDELRYARDKKQFKECTQQLWNAIQTDSELRMMFTEKQLQQIERGITPKGYTWHHDIEVGKMQLVKSDIHKQTGHTGGRSLWGGGKTFR